MSEGLAVTFRGTTTSMLFFIFFISIYQKTTIELSPHYERFAHMDSFETLNYVKK